MSKCKHKTTMLTRGSWGPHRAKEVCVECGIYIKWHSCRGQQTDYQQRTGVKYVYGTNTQTKNQVPKPVTN